MSGPKPGDIVAMTNFKSVQGADKERLEISWKSPTGRRTVFMLLGLEAKDGSTSLDAMAVLRELGWEPIDPEKKKAFWKNSPITRKEWLNE